MASRIRLGFIGAGMMAQNVHLPSFARRPEVDVVAICSTREGTVAQSVKQYGIPEVCTDYRDLLAISEVDAVVIAVPNHLHAEISIQALRAGKHVLCERPMAIQVSEAEAIRRAQKESGRVFMQGLPDRFEAEPIMLKKLIDKGHLGNIYYCKAGITLRRGCPGGWYTSRTRSGGGALQHLGAPLLDLILWFLNYPTMLRGNASTFRKLGESFSSREDGRVTVASTGSSPRPWDILGLRFWGRNGRAGAAESQPKGQVYDVEETACAMLDLAGGTTVLLEASWSLNCREDGRYLQLYGDAGGAELWPLRLYHDLEGTPVDIVPHRIEPEPGDRMARHFLDCILKGQEPEGNIEQGIALAHILQSLYQSADQGKEIAGSAPPSPKESASRGERP